MPSSKVWPGQPYPLGATWDGKGVNFALFSAHAERVELCLFDSSGQHEQARIALPEYTDEVWHCYLPEARPGQLYGYRVHGPYEPAAGHRFNPNKLLLDPYARAISGQLRWSDVLAGKTIRGGASLFPRLDPKEVFKKLEAAGERTATTPVAEEARAAPIFVPISKHLVAVGVFGGK